MEDEGHATRSTSTTTSAPTSASTSTSPAAARAAPALAAHIGHPNPEPGTRGGSDPEPGSAPSVLRRTLPSAGPTRYPEGPRCNGGGPFMGGEDSGAPPDEPQVCPTPPSRSARPNLTLLRGHSATFSRAPQRGNSVPPIDEALVQLLRALPHDRMVEVLVSAFPDRVATSGISARVPTARTSAPSHVARRASLPRPNP